MSLFFIFIINYFIRLFLLYYLFLYAVLKQCTINDCYLCVVLFICILYIDNWCVLGICFHHFLYNMCSGCMLSHSYSLFYTYSRHNGHVLIWNRSIYTMHMSWILCPFLHKLLIFSLSLPLFGLYVNSKQIGQQLED